MPELPEVQSYADRIARGALNRTIAAVRLGNDTKHVDLPGPTDRERLEGRQFTEVRRHGKYLFAGSSSGPWMALHMGMSGSVRVYDEGEPAPDYARLIVAFEGDRRMAFRDPRKFGWVKVVDDPEGEIAARDLGPDALRIDADIFADRLSGGRGAIKSALLDQSRIAGIGNLWADETLYQAGLHPETKVDALSDDDIRSLHRVATRVLKGVCDTGANYADLPDAWLIHRREAGTECGRCDGTIETRKVGGRTTFFCPGHQPNPT